MNKPIRFTITMSADLFERLAKHRDGLRASTGLATASTSAVACAVLAAGLDAIRANAEGGTP